SVLVQLSCYSSSPARRRRRAPPFPYTTLFRSGRNQVCASAFALTPFEVAIAGRSAALAGREFVGVHRQTHAATSLAPVEACGLRSEEHTSELQSRENLVCRLLLEKKKSTAHQQ